MDKLIGLSIVIPCYNEQDRLTKTTKSLIEAADRLDINYEIILVNDWSQDDTHNIMKKLANIYKQVIVISYETNKWKWYAVKQWVQKSQWDYYLIMDADLATDLEALQTFWSNRKTSDCIIWNRKNSQNKRTFFRNSVGLLSHGIITSTLGLKLEDTQCGFKLLSAKTKQVWKDMESERRWFDFELLYILQKRGYTIKELDVKRFDMSGSKVTITSYITTFIELNKMAHRYHIKTLDRAHQVILTSFVILGFVLYGLSNASYTVWWKWSGSSVVGVASKVVFRWSTISLPVGTSSKKTYLPTIRDYCPKGDYSASYYDWVCNDQWIKPTSAVIAPVKAWVYKDAEFESYKTTLSDIKKTSLLQKSVYKMLDYGLINWIDNNWVLYGPEEQITYGALYKIYSRLSKLTFYTSPTDPNRATKYYRAGMTISLWDGIDTSKWIDDQVSRKELLSVTKNLYLALGKSTEGNVLQLPLKKYPTRGDLAIFLNTIIWNLEDTNAFSI